VLQVKGWVARTAWAGCEGLEMGTTEADMVGMEIRVVVVWLAMVMEEGLKGAKSNWVE